MLVATWSRPPAAPPGSSVPLEQVREHQFWRILGQALDIDGDHLPFGELLTDLPQIVLEPTDHHRVTRGTMHLHPAQNFCGSSISRSAEKLFECPLCGVADRKSLCSKRG